MENDLLSSYPKVYTGKYVEIYDLSVEIPQVAFAYWKGIFKLTNAQFVEEMLWSAEYVREKSLKAYISDHSQSQVANTNVVDWLHNTWYGRVNEYGLLAEISLNTESNLDPLGLPKRSEPSRTGRVLTIKVHNLAEALQVASKLVAVKALP